ncbi:response regulator transcription factor [Nonomuraea sediminis]|uniref:response regulator transcription factor n=1 Tax=Nonomuraea sediminis TaxID=2835864 RepID=UPI001BDC2B69|nr:LuxR C-terminal-related transcriptional regulator [Nonomuraea sediminis]
MKSEESGDEEAVLIIGGDQQTRDAILDIISDHDELSSTVQALQQASPSSTVIIVGVSSAVQDDTEETQETSVSVLSRREQEVLARVAEALSNAQIASRMGITEGTVKRHLRNIFAKLGAVSRMDAVIKGGVVSARPRQPDTDA